MLCIHVIYVEDTETEHGKFFMLYSYVMDTSGFANRTHELNVHRSEYCDIW